MTSNGGSGIAATAPAPVVEDAGAAELRALTDHVREAERHLAAAVLSAGRLAGSGVCERVEGLPLELLLALACRLTGADRRMLVTAGEVLADMPATARLFRDGAISWGQVRAIVGTVRRLPAADRGQIDARVAASAERFQGIDAYDPDQLVWAVDQAAEQLRDRRSVERTQERRRASSFLSVQAALDGGMRLYGELDAVKAAPVLNALDAAAGAPAEDVAHEAIDESDGPAWSGTARGRQYADALEAVCAEWLSGGSGRRARPLLVAHVDVSQLRAEAGGTVEMAVRGDLPRVTAATLEALAASADVRAVVFDGARPLAVTGKVKAESIPADTRFAVRARDLGCRFPGSADPLGHTDVHHMVHREHGGDHHPENLVSLSRRHHSLAHRHGWRLRIAPDSGIVTARRRHRAWRSLPRGTPLASPRDDDGEPADPALPF